MRVVLFGWALAAGFGACTEHEYEVDRVGGPLPSVDGSTSDAACALPGPNTIGAELPCDVDAVLEAKCRRCHTDPPLNGAPFPLLSWRHTQLEYFAEPIYERMFAAVSSGFMPLCAENSCGSFDPPVEKLTDSEKSTLLDWLGCPQPSFGQTCGD